MANLDISKIYVKMPYPYVEFDEKHDGDIAKDHSRAMPKFLAKMVPRA